MGSIEAMGTLGAVQALWLALMAVWLIGRFTAKRVKQRESPVAYLGRIVMIVALFEFLFNPSLAIAWLVKRFIPASQVRETIICAGVSSAAASNQ
jgi:hypothetical protein